MNKLRQAIKTLLYFFIFLLPWQTRWIYDPGELNAGFWEYGTKSLYITEILLGIIIVLALVYIIKLDVRDYKAGKMKLNWLGLVLLLTERYRRRRLE